MPNAATYRTLGYILDDVAQPAGAHYLTIHLSSNLCHCYIHLFVHDLRLPNCEVFPNVPQE